MTDIRTWVAGARPGTLPAAAVAVLVGTTSAMGVPHLADGKPVLLWIGEARYRVLFGSHFGHEAVMGTIGWRFAAALVVALALQVGVNYANAYVDARRGTGDPGEPAGPPRAVGGGRVPARSAAWAAVLSFAVAAAAGLALAAVVTWWLVVVGAAAIAAGWFLPAGRRRYGDAGFGAVFVFVFVGLVVTVGSAFVQTGHLSGWWAGDLSISGHGPDARWLAHYPVRTVLAGAAVGSLATAAVLVDIMCRIPSDTAAGLRTLAVKLGDRGARALYVVLIVVPFLVVPVIASLGHNPFSVAALLAVVLVVRPVVAVLRGAGGPDLVRVRGMTARAQFAFGVLLAAGLFMSF